MVRAAVASWAVPHGVPAPDPLKLDGVDAMISDGIVMMLGQRGVGGLGGGGRPVAAGHVTATDPFRPAAPERHLLSCYLRHSASVRYSALLAQSRASDRTRLLSAAGPTAGTSLTAPLSYDGITYSDRQWACALRWRLGVADTGPPQPCMNQGVASGEMCEEILDAQGDHAVECERGPLRNHRHNAIADDYAGIVEEIGAMAWREVFVAEWSSQREAVWMCGCTGCWRCRTRYWTSLCDIHARSVTSLEPQRRKGMQRPRGSRRRLLAIPLLACVVSGHWLMRRGAGGALRPNASSRLVLQSLPVGHTDAAGYLVPASAGGVRDWMPHCTAASLPSCQRHAGAYQGESGIEQGQWTGLALRRGAACERACRLVAGKSTVREVSLTDSPLMRGQQQQQ